MVQVHHHGLWVVKEVRFALLCFVRDAPEPDGMKCLAMSEIAVFRRAIKARISLSLSLSLSLAPFLPLSVFLLSFRTSSSIVILWREGSFVHRFLNSSGSCDQAFHWLSSAWLDNYPAHCFFEQRCRNMACFVLFAFWFSGFVGALNWSKVTKKTLHCYKKIQVNFRFIKESWGKTHYGLHKN